MTTPDASAPPAGGPLPGSSIADRRELFWQNVVREYLNSLAVTAAMFGGRLSASASGAAQGSSPVHELFDGRMAVITKLGQRIPIADVERGLGTVPLFFRRMTLQPFSDIGGAWSGKLAREAIKVGAGASLIFTFKIGYLEYINLFVTYAHGFDKIDGIDTFRLAIARSL